MDAINEAKKIVKNGGDPTRIFGDVLDSVRAQIKNQPFLDGLARILDGLENDNKMAALFTNTATAFVPYSGLIKQTARATDPYMRETKQWGGAKPEQGETGLSRMGRRLAYSALPIPALAPPPKVDTWGNEVEKPNASFLGRLLFRTSAFEEGRTPEDIQRIDRAVMEYNAAHPEDPIKISGEQPAFDFRKKKYFLSDQEYHDYEQAVGRALLQRFNNLKVGESPITETDKRVMDRVMSRTKEAIMRQQRAHWIQSRLNGQ